MPSGQPVSLQTAEDVIPFATYADYLKYLAEQEGYRSDYEELIYSTGQRFHSDLAGSTGVCITRFDRTGRCVYRHYPSYTSIDRANHPLPKRLLSDEDKSVAYQVICVDTLYLRSTWKALPFPEWLVNALGLDLSVEPRLWAYLYSHPPPFEPYRYKERCCARWFHSKDVLQVGNDLVVTLKAMQGVRPATGEFCSFKCVMKRLIAQRFYFSIHLWQRDRQSLFTTIYYHHPAQLS